uniref:Uncharacterized protein n=1 Tax=Plectus sambesii TaxID=2011161 RepID=A0A914WV98_9BILA
MKAREVNKVDYLKSPSSRHLITFDGQPSLLFREGGIVLEREKTGGEADGWTLTHASQKNARDESVQRTELKDLRRCPGRPPRTSRTV